MKFSVDKMLNYWFNLMLNIRDEYFNEQHEHLRKKYCQAKPSQAPAPAQLAGFS